MPTLDCIYIEREIARAKASHTRREFHDGESRVDNQEIKGRAARNKAEIPWFRTCGSHCNEKKRVKERERGRASLRGRNKNE